MPSGVHPGNDQVPHSRCQSCGGRLPPQDGFTSCLACSYPIERVRAYIARDNGDHMSHARDPNFRSPARSRRSMQAMNEYRRRNEVLNHAW